MRYSEQDLIAATRASNQAFDQAREQNWSPKTTANLARALRKEKEIVAQLEKPGGPNTDYDPKGQKIVRRVYNRTRKKAEKQKEALDV